MKELLKNIGNIALGLAVIIGAILLAVLAIKGGVWLSEKVLPVLSVVSGFAFLACLFILIPLAVFQSTRGFAAICLYVSSYVFGVCAWMGGLLLSYGIWGLTAVIVGLFLFGIGVVPVALLATAVNGLWSAFFNLILLIASTYGTRYIAVYVMTKEEERRDIEAPSTELVKRLQMRE